MEGLVPSQRIVPQPASTTKPDAEKDLGLSPMSPVSLEDVLSPDHLEKSWKTVRKGLRDQGIADLHDHLDVHRARQAFMARVRKDVLSGTYRPREATVVRLEKNLGITRRLVLPTPADAVLLQAISDAISDVVIAQAPTRNSYYSRSHRPPNIEDWEESPEYPWWILWPEFQRRIWGFSRSHDYVILTDIANYFDTIPLYLLRNKLAALNAAEEKVLDLLLYLLEAFVWRPDYIPHSGVGLPQLDFDAPRLLAHAFLYDVDHYLHGEVKDEFARWMDDINIGVENRTEGKRILGGLDARLNTLGVRINAGKSVILSATQASGYLWIRENLWLTVFRNLLRLRRFKRAGTIARRRFEDHWQAAQTGHWVKVLKRYLTLFKQARDPAVETRVPEILETIPAVRTWVFAYYRALGYSPTRFGHIHHFLTSGQCVDDLSMFEACHLLVSWRIPLGSRNLRKVRELPDLVWANRREDVSALCAGLWLKVKYDSDEGLLEYLKLTKESWRQREWAGRQVAAVWPKLSSSGRQWLEGELARNGLLEGLRVLGHLGELRRLSQLDHQLKSYLYHAAADYPLYKVLVAKSLMGGNLGPSAEDKLRADVCGLMNDKVLEGVMRYKGGG